MQLKAAGFFKYVWPFVTTRHQRVNYQCSYHVETSRLIFTAIQSTCFYVVKTLVVTWLSQSRPWNSFYLKTFYVSSTFTKFLEREQHEQWCYQDFENEVALSKHQNITETLQKIDRNTDILCFRKCHIGKNIEICE